MTPDTGPFFLRAGPPWGLRFSDSSAVIQIPGGLRLFLLIGLAPYLILLSLVRI